MQDGRLVSVGAAEAPDLREAAMLGAVDDQSIAEA
jgi:hypothetical protein